MFSSCLCRSFALSYAITCSVCCLHLLGFTWEEKTTIWRCCGGFCLHSRFNWTHTQTIKQLVTTPENQTPSVSPCSTGLLWFDCFSAAVSGVLIKRRHGSMLLRAFPALVVWWEQKNDCKIRNIGFLDRSVYGNHEGFYFFSKENAADRFYWMVKKLFLLCWHRRNLAFFL